MERYEIEAGRSSTEMNEMDYRGDNYHISCIDGSAGLQSLEE